MAKDQETEENRGEEEEGTSVEEVETILTTAEPTQDKEMEPQAGDKGEVRGDPNILKLMELMNSMNEKLDRNKEETNENFKKQNDKFDSMKEETNDNFQKQKEEMKEKFNKSEESLKQINEK